MEQAFKAIFADAFRRVLPRQKDPLDDTTKRDETIAKPVKRRASPIRRRGSGFTYTPGPSRYHGRAGTWGAFMVRTILAHTSSWEAEQAHRASGEYENKKLDFNWMIKNQYITRS